ncbi:MAG TPA: hypothetical protein DCZ10_02135, partial [Pelotomaculum sp.]|nr:hypothetical protein [Pelotomaculum sp.]
TRWGPIHIRLQNLPEIFDFETHLSVHAGAHMAVGQLYAGAILFYLLLTAVLYALSAWLIDHKVEV